MNTLPLIVDGNLPESLTYSVYKRLDAAKVVQIRTKQRFKSEQLTAEELAFWQNAVMLGNNAALRKLAQQKVDKWNSSTSSQWYYQLD